MRTVRMSSLSVSLAAIVGVFVVVPAAVASQRLFHDVREYGAVANDDAKDTDAIRKAVDAAADAGGGTVYLSAGRYISGAIRLKSNVTLYLDAGAILAFSQDFDDYLPMVQSRWEGTECVNFCPPLYAYRAENIAIVGRGLIDGQGRAWWDFHRKLRAEIQQNKQIETPVKWAKLFAEKNAGSTMMERWESFGCFLRPPMIQPVECRNVRIEGVSLKDPPFWTINPVYCDNVTVTGVSIKNPDDSPNTDGVNPDSCRNVHISDCHISVGDDCITIKSGRDEDGRRVGRPCENITVTNCTMLDGHGGVVIGSEMSGGVRRVAISNCIFDGTERGIRIKTTRGRGGAVEDIRVSNVVMTRIKSAPFDLNMFYQKTPEEPVSERTPVLRNMHFSDITVKDSPAAGFILGLAEMPVDNVTFSNLAIEAEKGFSCSNARNIAFRNVRINTKKGPALIGENLQDLEVDGFRTLTPHDNCAVIDLKNASVAYVHGCSAASGTGAFLGLRGPSTRDILLQNNDLRQAGSPVQTTEGCPPSAVIQN